LARYRIVPERSLFWAEARSSVHPIRVETNGFEGYLELELQDGGIKIDAPVSGHVELEVDRLKTGNGLYDRELERKLEARRYPRIKGEVLGVQPVDGGNCYRVSGQVSFHGATKPVEGEVTIRVADGGRVIEADGERAFDIRDYRLEPPKLLMLKVYPDVKVRGHVVAEREE
jgi:polyisoprenoid-binding protein YceI